MASRRERLGDLERCALRPGNVHSADGWRGVLEPVIARYPIRFTGRLPHDCTVRCAIRC